jgi:streptogramin lyase
MAKWAHADVLDNGPNFIKTNCNSWVCVATYAAGDSYATVTGGSNILAQVAMTGTDFTNGASGSDRTLTVASGKSDASANNTGAATHLVFLDTSNSKVLWATEETSGQTITSGNPVNFPSGIVYTAKQPVAP